MHTEYEVRVLEIDKDELIKKIENLGGKKVADFDYKRRIYNFTPERCSGSYRIIRRAY